MIAWKTAVALTAVLGAPTCAFAGTHTITETYAIATAAPPYTVHFQLNGFDTSLGTLTDIELKLSTSTTATLDVFNTLATSQTFNGAYVSVPMKVTGPGGVSVQAVDDAGPASGTVAAAQTYLVGDPPKAITSDGTKTIDGLTGSASGATQVASADFGLYEGATVSLSYSALTQVGFYPGSAVRGVAFSGTAETGGAFDLVYTYTTPIPEGSTWAMMGLGLAGLGFAGFHSNRKSARFAI